MPEKQITLTEDEAHAIGYAISHTLRELCGNKWAEDLTARLNSVSDKLEKE